MSKSNRRSYIDLAESIRTLNVSAGSKQGIANDVAASLEGEEGFSAGRFIAHATSEDADAKWEFNKANDLFPQGLGTLGDSEDEDELVDA